MCCRAASRWLAHSVAVLADLVGGEVGGNFRGQDKRTHIAWRFWGGRLLVLRGVLSLQRDVWQNCAHCDFCTNGSLAGRCHTLHAVS
jgi:hypothetical protein